MPNNPRSNLIPVSAKYNSTAKSTKLPSFRPLSASAPIYKKPASTQTDKLIFIKEETLVLSFARIGVNDGGMRRDYLKAVKYINDCHKFINGIMEKNCTDRNNLFILPQITNFIPMFPNMLCYKKNKTKGAGERADPSPIRSPSKGANVKAKVDDRRSAPSRRQSAGKSKKLDLSPVSIGDHSPRSRHSDAVSEPEESKVQTIINDSVKHQLNQFMRSLQEDIFLKTSPTKKSYKSDSPISLQRNNPKPQSKSPDRFQSDDEILQNKPLPPPPTTSLMLPPPPSGVDDKPCNFYADETTPTTIIKAKGLKITPYDNMSSESSNSSDIVSDSEG